MPAPHRNSVNPIRNRIQLVLLVLAAALVVTLTLQNRSLQQRHVELQERNAWPHAGLFVPPFAAHTVRDSAPVVVGEPAPGRRQLVLLFATTCQYCRASLPAWRQLSQSLAGDSSVGLVAVSLDSVHHTRAYAQEHDLPWPVVTFPDSRYKSLYRARTVPQLLVSQADGRVSCARRGVLADQAAIDSVLVAARANAPR